MNINPNYLASYNASGLNAFIGILSITYFSLLILLIWGRIRMDTGYWNPLKQYRYILEKKKYIKDNISPPPYVN